MNRSAWILVPLLIAATSTQAQARPAADTNSKEAQQYLAEFSDCVVKQKAYRTRVEAFLRSIPGTPEFDAAGFKAADLHCLDAAAARSHSTITMRMQPSVFRSGLYPALYKSRFGRTGPVSGLANTPPAQLSSEFDGPPTALPKDYRPLRLLGDCVARTAPQVSHALLLATPYKPAEDAAIEQLKPALETCITQRQTVKFNRIALRAAVGEAMYKLSLAALGPASGSKQRS